jgi:ribokinase
MPEHGLLRARVGVVGHVEWIDFAIVERLPVPGQILHAHEFWAEAGGGGAVAVVQLAKLAGRAVFYTALAGDELGHRARAQLEAEGVLVHAAARPGAQRRGFVYLDGDGERTITILGDRIVAHGDDLLPWGELDGVDGIYFTGGDAATLRHVRRARFVVAHVP